MSCGLIRILSKIDWWLFGPKAKLCNKCCLFCNFYKVCRADVEYLEEITGEPWE